MSTPLKQNGFAVVLALLLLSFVLLLLLSLSTFVRVEQKTATSRANLTEAQSNALLGLQLAIGNLQRATGPDQRTTARADIASTTLEENAYWTGVWKTIDNENPVQELEALRSWSTQANQVEWLISSEIAPAPDTPLIDSNPTSGTATLLKFTDRTTSSQRTVEAGRVPITLENGSSGHYAWWIADEGLKAKFNLSPRAAATEISKEWMEQQSSLLYPAQVGIEAISDITELLDYSQLTIEDHERIFKRADLSFIASDKTAFETFRSESIHDLTFSSYGVLSNQRDGGLRQDLSRALDDQFPQTLAGKPLWWTLAPDNSGRTVKGELWDVIYDYANLYREYPHWQFSGTIKDSGFTYDYAVHNQTGPVGLSAPSSPTSHIPTRFFGPESTSGKASFNRLGKNLGTYTYFTNLTAGQFVQDNWGVNESGSISGRPVWNALNPVILATLWRVGIGSSDLLQYSKSAEFKNDGATTHGMTSDYDQRQYDKNANYPSQDPADPTNEILYDHPGGAGYGSHPLDLPADWEGRPETGPHARIGPPQKYYRLHFALQPVVVLWNPYNVPLHITDLLVTPKFEPWVSIDYDTGTGSGIKPIKLHKFKKSGSTPAFRIVDDHPHTIDGHSNNPSEQSDRFLLADDGIMAGSELISGINITDYTLGPGQIEVFSLNGNTTLPNTSGGPMVARPINTDAVLIRKSPLKHDFPEGTHINKIQLFYSPSDVPNENEVDERLNTMSLNAKYQGQDLSPGTKTDTFVSQMAQFGPNAPTPDNWDEKHNFEIDINIEEAQIPYSGNNMDLNEPFTNVFWFSVIGAQTKSISETQRSVPHFSQFNVTRIENRANPSNSEFSGILWDTKFYSDPEFQDAIESSEIPFWDGDDEIWNGIDQLVLKEIPRQPLGSVGQLMNANISINDWDPLYAVGSSYAHPLIAPTKTINLFNQQKGSNTLGDTNNLAVDISFLSNERLFDKYFFSTIPPQNEDPSRPGYSSTYQPDQVPPFKTYTADDLKQGSPFPNTRMIVHKSTESTDWDTSLDDLRDYEQAASQLLINGAFNINSTSVNAWKALFSSLRGKPIPNPSGNIGVSGEASENSFPRVPTPLGDNTNSQESLFTGFTSLNDTEIETLAETMVDEVKKRGPFLSLADFVNRRLEDSELGKMGALQAALDNAINSKNSTRFGENVSLGSTNDDDLWLTDAQSNQLLRPDLLVSKLGNGLPQWILQNDIIRAIAPQIQARSDTFVIRAYGDSSDGTGENITRIWCEATLQRFPDYVDTSATPDPTTPPWTVAPAVDGSHLDTMTRNLNELSSINLDFGRRYKVVDFRWLSEKDL